MATGQIQVYVLCGINTNLIGLNIDGWSIKAAYEIPTSDDDHIITFQKLNQAIGAVELFSGTRYIYDNGVSSFYIYLMKLIDNPHSVKPVIDVLRTYKSSGIGTFCPISFKEKGGYMVNAFPSYGYAPPRYSGGYEIFSLYENEIKDFLDYFACANKQHPAYVKNMLSIFHESYRIDNFAIRFIMSITILEMLIDGNAELKYRLSRSVAVLLGKTKEESTEIFNTCKKLYDIRSQYLHNGDDDKITTINFMLALDYSRRMIANLMVIDEDIQAIRNRLDSEGYGSNPFKVRF